MILTDYYKMQEIRVRKSHRFDCTASTGGYNPFEAIADKCRDKVKRFFFYYGGVPDSFNAHAHRQADRVITNGDNLSSVYVPDLDTPLIGYGDMRGTNDALLFMFAGDYKQIEIFVARGYKNNAKGLFTLFADGELADEVAHLRQQAIPTNAD